MARTVENEMKRARESAEKWRKRKKRLGKVVNVANDSADTDEGTNAKDGSGDEVGANIETSMFKILSKH